MKKTKNKKVTIHFTCILSTFFLLVFSMNTPLSAGKPAARMGDTTAHGGTIIIGCPSVLIGGQPAARVGDMHTCPMVTPAGPATTPHVGGPIQIGSSTVLICGKPAARVGDMAICQGPPDHIVTGSATVLIGN